jgi:hypothetical protein
LLNYFAVFVQQDGRGLPRNTEVIPDGKGGVPIHMRRGDLSSFHESLSFFEVILRADSDNGKCLYVLSSKLLDTGGFPVTSASMWRPEPRKGGKFAAIVDGEVNFFASLQIENLG